MSRVRLGGGVSGVYNVPSSNVASGIWTLRDNEDYKRVGQWPTASPAINFVNATILIVGGGAGGGGWTSNWSGGGGGAGGVVYNTNVGIPVTNYVVTVGAGGSGGTGGSVGTNGSNSYIIGNFSLTALGGGGGGASANGIAGGSGGGGGGAGPGLTEFGGLSTQSSIFGYGFGNPGGTSNSTTYNAGGGGGAGANGNNANTLTGGTGGAGLAYNFANGTSIYYAGGGGGAGVNNTIIVAGGLGGGGNSANQSVSSTAGGVNLGGGGGGGGFSTARGNGNTGGSGVVVVSYPLPQYWRGGTVTNNNGTNVVHTFTSSGSLTALPTPIDTYQPYNTLLFHADGTVGSNNSFVTDSSVSTYIPFPNTYSYYFAGLSSGGGGNIWLQAPTISSIAIGTGAFTAECWVYPTYPSGTYSTSPYKSTLFFLGPASGSGYLNLYIANTGQVVYGRSGTTTLTTTGTVPFNQWTHIAVSRTGNTTNVYLNGSNSATSTTDTSSFSTATNFYLGGDGLLGDSWGGYISNFRLVNGVGLYSNNFTPSTTPLTAVPNTFILTAQSPGFVDNSNNGFVFNNPTVGASVSVSAGGLPVTKAGNTYLSTFTPTSTTGWSNYFNGTGGFSTSGANLAFQGLNFTIEAWVYPTTISTGFSIYDQRASAYTTAGLYAYLTSNGTLAIRTNDNTQYNGSIIAPLNQWSHVAVTKNSGIISLWVNGQLSNTISYSTTLSDSSTNYIGRTTDNNAAYAANGYISNLRVINGTSLYNSNFTPPTSTLTAVSNTILLTSQSNQFVDNSQLQNPLTVIGTPRVVAFSPFNPSSVYSNTINGGSISFDNTAFMAISGNNNFNFTSNSLTFECWVYTTSNTATQSIISCVNTGQTTGYEMTLNSTGNVVINAYIPSSYTASGGFVQQNQWNHIAYVISSGTNYLFINGVSQPLSNNIPSSEFNANINPMFIGSVSYTQTEKFNGYISGLRLSNTAFYTSNFTPNTGPLPTTANSVLVINGSSPGLIDNTQKNTIYTFGNVVISNTQSQFGGTSLYFYGPGGTNLGNTYAMIPYSPYINLSSSNNFTVECWFNTSNSVASQAAIITKGMGSSTTGSYAAYLNNNKINFALGDETSTNIAASYTYPTAIANNTWYHIAIERNGANAYFFVNGSLVSTAAITTFTMVDGGSPLTLGTMYPPYQYYQGYIDEVRITKGITRYTANFTPSSTSFVNT